MRVYVDFETTGLSPLRERVVEVAAVEPGGRRFSMLARPEPEVMARLRFPLYPSGITKEELDEALPLVTVAGMFKEWLQELGPCTLWAYNSAFEMGFAQREPWSIGRIHWGGCVMRKASRGGRYRKLRDVAASFGLEWEGDAHRALADARMAMRVDARLDGRIAV